MFYQSLRFIILTITTLLLIVSCRHSESINAQPVIQQSTPNNIVISASPTPTSNQQQTIPVTDENQLVDIQTINQNIAIDIRYATKNNFLKKQLYPEARCVLRYGVAQKLAKVQADLEKNQLGLKVYDCYRPLSVQKLMWQTLPDNRYVANPAYGSRHNRGAAIDLTLVNRNRQEIEMPSAFDTFTPASHRDYSGGSTQSRKNRQLLEDAMKKQGFTGLSTEWWHFDAPGWENFPVMDVPFSQIHRSAE
ncbi:M15 family metallopeptidase [Aliinostoc sp. HNIBRCY26]|uniref:M15 family metallopeptidase n=1 Tax=Aliinostoc sp. HNIBRCY26 TaxID=3418997 RepID=UPI003CFC0C4C